MLIYARLNFLFNEIINSLSVISLFSDKLSSIKNSERFFFGDKTLKKDSQSLSVNPRLTSTPRRNKLQKTL